MTKIFKTSAVAMLAAGLAVSAAKADQTFGLDFNFSGPPPGGATPWLSATFSDIAGGVQLTLSGANLAASEFVGGWYFNLSAALDPTSLVFTRTDAGPVVVDGIGTGANAYKADGDGFFDILIDFQTSSGIGRFSAGDSVVYTITGIPGLNAAMFNYQSTLGGGNGVWYTAAHIQALTNGQSVWIGDGDGGGGSGGGPVPEPTTMVILASFAGLAVFLKRRYSAV